MTTKKFAALAAMLGIVAAFVAADFCILYATYVDPQYIAGEMERLIGRPVALGDISAGPLKGVVIKGVAIPGRDRKDLLRAEQIRIEIDRGKLLDGEAAVKSIELTSPMVRMEMTEEGGCDLLDLVTEVSRRLEGETSKRGGAIPRIHITDGTLLFGHKAILGGPTLQVRHVDANILPYADQEFIVEGVADAGHLGRWKIEGKIDTESGRIELRFSTRNLVVGPETVAAFAEPVRAAYANYNVAGPVDASVSIVHDAREAKPLTLAAEISSRGIEITYHNFPYRVVGVEGLIRLKDDGIEFENMVARMWMSGGKETATPVKGKDPVEITMSGSTDGYVRESAYNLHFTIGHLPVDTKLRGALQEGARNVYDMFSPTGAVSGRVTVVKPRGEGHPVNHIIDMQLENCTATFQPFPYPVTDATGRILLDGDKLTISGARCRHGEAWFDVEGELTSLEADGGIVVKVKGRNIPLDDDAKSALPLAVQEAWSAFEPQGKIDIDWTTTRDEGPDKELSYDVTITPRGVRARYRSLPYMVTDISSGSVWTDAKRLHIRDLIGRHGAAELRIGGTVDGLDEAFPAYALSISAREVPVDGELRAALPGDFKAMLEDIGLKGVVRLEDLKIRKGGKMPPDTMEFEAGRIEVIDGSFQAGLEFKDVSALLQNVAGKITDGKLDLLAELAPSKMQIAGLQVTNLTGNVHYLPDNALLMIQDLEGGCYAGRLKGSVAFRTDSSEFEVKLHADQVDLLQLTRDTSQAGRNIAGKVNGLIELKGAGGDGATYTGDGHVSIKDSQLWEVPVLAGILSGLKLTTKDSFRRGDVVFTVANRRLNVTDLEFHSDSVDLHTQRGWLDFDGNLRLKLTPKIKTGSIASLLGADLVVQILKGIMAIQVTGTWSEPNVSLRGSVDIEEIFRK